MKRVVITGMGIISPIGNNLNDFTKSLFEGKCGVDYITRFDVSDFKVKVAAEVKNFDPLTFMNKGEVRKTDLFVQYALSAAAQAMEQSGIDGKISPERLGVYVGSGIGGMETFYKQSCVLNEKGPRRVSPHFVPMIIGNIAAGHIAIKHNARGPVLPTVTACATSSHEIGEAYRAIKYGYADAIIAGGSEATIIPLSIAGFTNCMALSTKDDPSIASIPFDIRRDGFVMGEGSAMLVLEEYEHAVSRGVDILAEICGYGNTSDAYHVTAPRPDGEGAAKAISLALEEVGNHDIESIYINAHGTSTPLNDKTETLAIKKVFGERAYDVLVSSTKSMTGHMLGASGAAEAIACILAITKGQIPPTIGYNEKDPECDLDYVPNIKREKRVDVALSNSLGFGGHNACLAFKRI